MSYPVQRNQAAISTSSTNCNDFDDSKNVNENDFVSGTQTQKRKIIYPNGTIYEGDFVDGVCSGKGKYTYINRDVYEGDIKRGKRVGKGTYAFNNGSIYEGDWVEGKRTGKGIFTFADGTVYEGEFIDGTVTKKGTLLLAGCKYTVNMSASIDKIKDLTPYIYIYSSKYNFELLKSIQAIYAIANCKKESLEIIKTLIDLKNLPETLKSTISSTNDGIQLIADIAQIILNCTQRKTVKDLSIIKFSVIKRLSYSNDGLLQIILERMMGKMLSILLKPEWSEALTKILQESTTSKKLSKTEKNAITASTEENKTLAIVSDSQEVNQDEDTPKPSQSARKRKRKNRKNISLEKPVAAPSNSMEIFSIDMIIKSYDEKTFFEKFTEVKKENFGTYLAELGLRMQKLQTTDELVFFSDCCELGLHFIRIGKFTNARKIALTISLHSNDYTDQLAEKIIESVIKSQKMHKFATARKTLALIKDKARQEVLFKLIESVKLQKFNTEARRESFAKNRRDTMQIIPISTATTNSNNPTLVRRNTLGDLKQGLGHSPLSEMESLRKYLELINKDQELRTNIASYKQLREKLESLKILILREAKGSHQIWGYVGYEYLGTITLSLSHHTKKLGKKILAQALLLAERKKEIDEDLT